MTAGTGKGFLRTAALAAFVVVLVMLLPRSITAADFGQDILVNSNSNKQEYPASAAGPNGYIYVIWQDDRAAPGSTYDIFVARSTDNGSSFAAPVRVDDAPASTDQLYPQLAVDFGGTLHAVWSDYRSGVNYRIYYANSTDNGSSWSPGVMVNLSASGGQYVPSITTDPSGNIYVVWDDGRSGNHIYFSKSTDGGSSWSAAAKLDLSGNAARYPWICYGPDGNLTVVWQDSRNTNWDVFMVSSGNGGASFGPEINVTANTSSTSQMWPRAAPDPWGGLHLVWDDNRFGNFGVFYGNSSDGQTFSALPVNDTNTGITASPPEPPGLAVDLNGAVHVCWQDKRGGAYNRIYYSESTGPGTFSANVRVDNTTTTNCHLPSVMVDPNNMPSVVWEDDRSGNLDVYFDAPQNVPPSAPDIQDPANDTWLGTGRPTFNWTFRDVNTSDTQSAYQLQLDNSSSFSSIDHDSGVVVSPNSTYTPASNITDGIYFWRARTRDQSGLWGPYSAARVVKMDTVAPSAATPSDTGVWCNTSSVNWTWAPSSDALSGVAGYYISIGTSAGAQDVLADGWTATPNFTYGGGTNGTTYYAKVNAKDNASNIGDYGSPSDGITVDVSVPSAGAPLDGGLYINSSLVRWSWPPSEDHPSGIAGYHVSIGSAPGQDDIVKDSWVASNFTTYPTGQNGITYYARVRAVDNAGNVGAFGGSSDGVTVDTSFPLSYTPADNGTYSNSTTLYWRWTASWDTPSGIAGYYVTVGTAYGVTVDGCFTASNNFTLAGAADGNTYYCMVLAADRAGNLGPLSALSDGITVDTTAPSSIYVTDDGMFTIVNTALHAEWTSSFDNVSGIVDHQFCIGTTAGAADVVPWTSAGQALSMTSRNLWLMNAVTCYVTVRAKNGAGLWSPSATSDGITVDITLPAAASPEAAGTWSASASIAWSWAASTDAPSGIRGYYVCIGSSPGASDVVQDGFTSDRTFTYPAGQNGRVYYAKIRAVDNAGNIGPYGEDSTPVTVDVSLPLVASPRDGGVYSFSPNITFTWSPGVDSPSGIMGYYLSIGTTPGAYDVLNDFWTSETSYELKGAEGGKTYYAFLRARDNAGNNGTASAPSDGILVDVTAPAAVTVLGGGYLRSTAMFPLSWMASYDPQSPVAGYRCALGTAPGASDAVNWTDAGLSLSWEFNGLALDNGKTYYASVQARNAAGLWSVSSSGAAVMVDASAPVATQPVHSGAFSNASVVNWSWTASSDAESGIAGYMVFIGTSPAGRDIVNGSWTAGTTFWFFGGVNGWVYYASVAAQDRAGNLGPWAVSSSGITVDITIPSAHPPMAGSEYSTVASFDWKWAPSQDVPSGIAGYFVSVGTSLGADDVVSDMWTVSAAYTFNAGQNGKTYFIQVRAQDNAGNMGAPVLGTSGVTVDLTPPSGSLVVQGGATTTGSRTVVLAITTNATDVSEMLVGTDPGLPGASWEPFARARALLLPEGDGPKTVYVRLRDGAGQESGVLSSSIMLNTSVAASGETGEEGWFSGDNASLLMLVLVIAAIVLVLVVLAVSLNTRRMLVAHLKAAQAAAVVATKEKPPKDGPAPRQAETAVGEPAKEKPVESMAPSRPSIEPDGWVERQPETAAEPDAAQAQQTAAWTSPEQTPASMLDALAAAAREPVTGQGAASGAPYDAQAGDVVIRADGTEAPAAEPKLVSEWSPETGRWAPVLEEAPAAPEATLPPEPAMFTEPSLIEEGPGGMAPEPTHALEDFARSFHAKEEAPARPEPAQPAAAAPGQRRSAKEIYDALYGKRSVAPTAAPAGPKAPHLAATAAAPAPAGAPVPEERKVLGKARCAQCKGVIPIYSAERPLKIKCQNCGLEGLIK